MAGPLIPQGHDVAVRLQSASQFLDRREPAAALGVLTPLLQWKSSADACALAGKAHRMLGAMADAEAMFRHALALKPRQAGVQADLGHVLCAQSRFPEAAAAFREAIKLEQGNLAAHLGLAGALHDAGDAVGAERAYRNLLRLKSDSIEGRQGLAVLLNDLERAGEAEEILRPALTQTNDPKLKAGVEHALGVSAARRNRLEEALAHFDNARRLDPGFPRIDQNRAAILQRLYRDEEALTILDDLVRRDLGNLSTHHVLNHILYRLGRDGEFLSSYDKAIARWPGRTEISLSKAKFLLAAERFPEAREIFDAAFKADETNKQAATGLLTALSQMREFDAAIAAGQKALHRFPDDVELSAGTAAALLRKGDTLAAERHVHHALSLDPHSQASLALQGLIWRVRGDSRDEALHDYQSHVRVYDLPPPAGYSSMEAFNHDLNAMLDSLHPPVREYVDQSLRRGTQTVGSIFGAGYDLVERLKVRIAEAVQAYIAAMPEDNAHPFYGRRKDGFRFAGSWSSRLRDQGFHTSHIHAEGWISSCYYVALPDAVADTQNRQGWIEFGRPPYEIGLKDPVQRAVQPRVGQLVLFPSYMLHGTIPFHATQARTTIAFDVVPG